MERARENAREGRSNSCEISQQMLQWDEYVVSIINNACKIMVDVYIIIVVVLAAQSKCMHRRSKNLVSLFRILFLIKIIQSFFSLFTNIKSCKNICKSTARVPYLINELGTLSVPFDFFLVRKSLFHGERKTKKSITELKKLVFSGMS